MSISATSSKLSPPIAGDCYIRAVGYGNKCILQIEEVDYYNINVLGSKDVLTVRVIYSYANGEEVSVEMCWKTFSKRVKNKEYIPITGEEYQECRAYAFLQG